MLIYSEVQVINFGNQDGETINLQRVVGGGYNATKIEKEMVL